MLRSLKQSFMRFSMVRSFAGLRAARASFESGMLIWTDHSSPEPPGRSPSATPSRETVLRYSGASAPKDSKTRRAAPAALTSESVSPSTGWGGGPGGGGGRLKAALALIFPNQEG